MPEAQAAPQRAPAGRRILAAAVLIAPTAIAFFSGGFFDKPRLVAGVLTWLALGGAALFGAARLPRSAGGRLMLGGLVALCVVTLASIGWAPIAGRALDDGQRVLLYVGFLALAISALRPRALTRWTEPAVAGGTVVVTGYALATRLLPGVVHPGGGYRAGGRLDQPLTYWNALGAVAALGLVLCARLAGDADRPRALRLAAAAVSGGLGAALYLTYSRGSILFAIVGLLALVVFVPRRQTVLCAALVAVAAGLGALSVAVLPKVADPLGGTSSSQGAMGVVLIVVVGAVAALVALPATAADAGARRPLLARLGLAGIAVALVAIAVLLLGGVSDVGKERVRVPTGPKAERLRSADSERYDYWKVAGRAFADHPVVGLGASGFAPRWLRERPAGSVVVRDAHSLYIETAAELGLVGLACLALMLAGVVLTAHRALRRDVALAAGPVAALIGWGIHAGLDWDWEMPAVTMPALILAALLVVAAEEEPAAPRPGIPQSV